MKTSLKGWLYDTENPNLDYKPGSQVKYDPETGKYYIGYPEKKYNDPVGEIWISFSPGTVEKIEEL